MSRATRTGPRALMEEDDMASDEHPGFAPRNDEDPVGGQDIAAQAGLPPLRLHGLRHSWATTAHMNHVSLRAIGDQLGHADTSVTDRIYTATLEKVQQEAAAKVAASVMGSRRGAPQGNGTESGQKP